MISSRPVVNGCRSLVLAALCGIAAGCGGGGGSDAPANAAQQVSNPAPTPAATPSPAPVITAFTPAIAAVGAQVTVTGTALAGVTAVRVGGVNAAFTPLTATSVQFTVPVGASSGRIEVSGASGAALSATDLTVMAVPTITMVSPASVKAGDTLTINGTNLSQVKSVTLNGVVLPFTGTRTATSIAVTVASNAATGFLTLVGLDDVARTSAQQITVTLPIVLSSFSPVSALVGANVILSGSGLAQVQTVRFSGSTADASISARSAGSMTVTVPAGATTGPITLASASETVRSSTNFTVVPRITVDGTAIYNVAAAGAAVTVTGSGLDQVSAVTVAGSSAIVSSRAPTQLVFAAPSGVACGAISLQSGSQPSVAAGTLVVGSGCSSAVNISGIEVAQVLAQNPASEYQRLTPGRETWVRAYVTSTTAGRAAPPVRLVSFNGTAQLGVVNMTGPATLPQLAAGAAPSDSLRYDLTQTFRVSLPTAWVATGLRLRVDVDPDNAAGVFTSQEAIPATGSATRLEIVVVPLISGSNTPTMPTATQVLDELARAMPIPRDQITVTFRAPYTITSTTDGVDTQSEWQNTLSELDQLRASEAPGKVYYGMVRPMVQSGIAGIGYVNPVNDNSPNPTSLGWDASRSSWTRTMVHELGHNFSRQHAPCGGVSSSDGSYPYPGGALGAAPLFNVNTDNIESPAGRTDVMGYCGGSWFSDYNLSFVQRFLEYQRSQGRLSVQSKPGEPEVSLITVSGTIDASGARIDSVLPATGAVQPAQSGSHMLELVTADGRQIAVPITGKQIDHAEPAAMHFTARIPNPGVLAKLRIVKDDKVIGEHLAAARFAKPGSDAAPWAQVNETAASATFTWNAASHSIATLVHLHEGRRTVLALKAQGGSATVDTSALPRGGVFEVGLSDGLNVQMLTLPR
jgi:trimeric autotransporter adhesin